MGRRRAKGPGAHNGGQPHQDVLAAFEATARKALAEILEGGRREPPPPTVKTGSEVTNTLIPALRGWARALESSSRWVFADTSVMTAEERAACLQAVQDLHQMTKLYLELLQGEVRR
jgi:hypothetical protein